MRFNAIDWIAVVLTIVGALNWGLVGLFRFDLVATLFGDMSLPSRLVYILVGVAGIWLIAFAVRAARASRMVAQAT
jgi:uncharacterized protein